MENKKEKTKAWRGILIFSYFLIAMMLLTGLWLWKRLPPEIPFLYSLPWGEQQLIDKRWWMVITGGMGFLVGITAFIAKRMEKNDQEIGMIIVRGGLIIVALYLLGFYQVVRLVLGI